MSTVQDTDLLLINRAGVDYKCSFADWKTSQASIDKPRLLTPANGAGQETISVSDQIVAIGTAANTYGSAVNAFVGGVDPGSSYWLDVNPPGSNVDYFGLKLDALFDGIDTNFLYWVGSDGTGGASGGVLSATFDLRSFAPVTSVKVLFDGIGYSGYKAEILNGSKLAAAGSVALTSTGRLTATVPTGSDNSYLRIYCPVGAALRLYLYGIEVNGTVLRNSASLTALTLSSTKGLTGFASGDHVAQDNKAASGIVRSVDAVAKKVVLSTSTGTWSANTGNTIIGAPKLGTDAAVKKTPTFTSTAFSATGTITHSSSDWQVTLKADTAFATPVVQSMTDTTNLVSWTPSTELELETDYIARVRHNAGGKQSPWSDVISFKTEKAAIVMAEPGDAWATSNGQALTAITAPVKLINLATSNAHLYGIGVDGKVYGCAYSGTAMTLVPYPRGNIVQVAPFYDASGGVPYTAVLTSDGAVYGYNAAGTEIPGPSGIKFKAIMSGGGVSDTVAAVAEDGRIYVFATTTYAGVSASLAAWVHYPVVLPGGRVPQKVASLGSPNNYLTDGIVILATDGTLWQMGHSDAPGLPAAGTYSAPSQVSAGTLFKQINNVGPACGNRFAIAALSTTGKIWYAAKAPESNSGVEVKWGEMTWGTGFKECIYGPYAAGGSLYGLKSDGYLYCSPSNASFNFVKVPGQTKTIASLGNIRSATQINVAYGYIIIP